MAEFNIRSDAVDVEQIMEQIRARVREKRGVDYTEEQIRELANVKLDRFLDPKHVRSDLIEHFRKKNQSSDAAASATQAALEAVDVPTFQPDDVYRSSRGGIGRVLYAIRRMLRPILKLFINPGPMLDSVRSVSTHINTTSKALALNEERNRRRAELDVLMYEVMNNLVVEMTRLAIDMKNHKMRVESVAARLDFDERRARALEQIVQFRTPAAGGEDTAPNEGSAAPGDSSGGEAGVTGETAAAAAAGATTFRRQYHDHGGPGGRHNQERTGRRLGIERRSRRGGGKCRTADRRGGRIGQRPLRTVKLAVVVQRYGADISGGAELHARYVAGHLSRHVEVEVLTTCARDYISWRNELAPGTDVVNGVTVLRFPVRRERDPVDFARRSHQVFEARHSFRDELRWLESEGPTAPALIAHLRRAASAYDFILFFSYRYYHAYHGSARRRQRPCSSRPPNAIRLLDSRSPLVLSEVCARSCTTRTKSGAHPGGLRQRGCPGVVVGVGSEIRDDASAARFRERTELRAASSSMSDESTRTRGAASCSITSGGTPPRSRSGCNWCSRVRR